MERVRGTDFKKIFFTEEQRQRDNTDKNRVHRHRECLDTKRKK